MRITSKGQVTIPAEIREKAGLFPNTEVEFAYEHGKVVIRRSRKVDTRDRGTRLVEHLRRHAGDIKMTTDEIMALTRGDD